MTITLRSTKGSALTHPELDGNFTDLNGRVTTAQGAATSAVASATSAQATATAAQSAASSATSAASAAQSTANGAAAAAAAASQPGHQHVLSDITDLLEFMQDELASALTAGANITLTYNDTTGKLIVAAAGAAGGSTLANGDYGDVVVSSDGAVINIDTNILSAFGRTVIGAADQAAGRAALGLGTAATASAASFAPLVGPALTGTPTAPTAVPGTTTTQLATTAFAMTAAANAVATLTNTAPAALDTVFELAAALGGDANFSTTVLNAIGGKQATSAVLTFLAGAGSADAAGVRALLNLAALFQPLSAVLTATTASYTTADKAKIDALPGAALTVTTGRAIAPTDANQVLQVNTGLTMTLDTGSLTNAGDIGSLSPTFGAFYSLTVGTATLRTRTGGPALAAATVIQSSLSQDGEITVRKESDGSYLLVAPVLNGLDAPITATGAFPARTTEPTQVVVVNSASAVSLDMSATVFSASRRPRGVLVYNVGAGSLTLTGRTTHGDAPTLAGKGRIILTHHPLTDNTPYVSTTVDA